MLRQYIQPKRALRTSRATVRFETEQGRQLQSDWGEILTQIAGQPTKVRFIGNTLGYSRRFHFWCTDSEDSEHTYEGILRSFEYFGGVTEEVLVDNQKSAALEHPCKGQPKFNERFIDLAGQYGFTPRACKPYRACTKGKDERMVGYVKGNFFVRYRSFESWAHLNQLAERWLAEGDLLVDGCVLNNLPIDIMQRLNHDGPIIAVNVFPDVDSLKDYRFGPSVSGVQALASKLNPLRRRDSSAPLIFESLVRVLALNDVHQAKTKRGFADVYIRPPVEKYNILDFGAYAKVAEIGYRSAIEALGEWENLPRRESIPVNTFPGCDTDRLTPRDNITARLDRTLAELEQALASMERPS